ncbi:hypothetical protein L249_6958 [Ophiocordyceps polyrhachis-furcata BCC 54312]|uniref:Uncharacterized protein n=1 Tax=Ophiocordyceps polyrhachis-furcata BCC 54312 TaxID=1330021 RepID=A0A367LJS3_9HYPO|nr:hypothetical protein L249_6958 [Ophiocordyceps polyrhachis-furcata BCC 54312]
MLALLDTSAETNILTASAARDLNLEYRPIQFSAILEGERLTFNRLEEIRLRIIETLSDAE